MEFDVTRRADGRPVLSIHDPAADVQVLEAAPASREPMLDEGTWLVLVFAVWSGPDVAAIETAMQAAARFGERLALGVRPFDSPDEHATWCPAIAHEIGSPLWLVMTDGRVLVTHTGPLSVTALVELIGRAIAA